MSSGDNNNSDGDSAAESIGQYTTLKPSVSAVQPTKITNPTKEEESSEKIASAMAERHSGDPSAFRRVDPPQGDEKKESAGEGEEKAESGFVEKWKICLAVSGIVVAVLGAVLAACTKLKGKTPRD
ncbi:hypothetical protein SUGI_1167750 [Cryptomeria japonica]|uniref:uncharacterized protein LOC131068463 n=1 Tax=Cryptomeria japonica TaxID=3369 RepID=UPI0024149F63|nr:uncharacterized protein LOC131068463 [Cryptomeria japonica]GLJ54379.1 hypothetical protein SUGI_1167750 [Cryptomeria japonica]